MLENHEQAKLDYLAGMKYQAIADKYGTTINTVKSWKVRYKWSRKGVHTNREKVCTQNEKSVHTKKKRGAPQGNNNAVGHGAPIGNQNAVGNTGGAPPGNSNAVIHGLHAKYLPSETLEIADSLVDVSPLDILWGNICIKYASILRAQQIMYVTGKDEMIKELKRSYEKTTTRSTTKTNSDSNECEYEYEFQFSWDRHATFLKAQSLAMSTLSNMIKQYESLCKSDLATEEQRARIDKLKAEVDKLKAGGDGVGSEDSVQFVDDIGSDDDADG
jgi:uncharacterized protein YjcR